MRRRGEEEEKKEKSSIRYQDSNFQPFPEFNIRN